MLFIVIWMSQRERNINETNYPEIKHMLNYPETNHILANNQINLICPTHSKTQGTNSTKQINAQAILQQRTLLKIVPRIVDQVHTRLWQQNKVCYLITLIY